MARAGTPNNRESDGSQPEDAPTYPSESDATQRERPRPYPSGSDATQLEPPRPYPSGSDATQLERPPSYPPGSAATQFGRPPPSGYPPGTPYPAVPLPTERPVGPSRPPPLYPGGGYPPPPQPPAHSRRGLFFGIGGVLLVLLVVVAGIVILTTHNRGDTSDALSTQQAAIGVASAPATIPTTATTATTTTATPIASAAPAFSGPTDRWTDPENRVTVSFPADWQKDTFDTRDENRTLDKSQPLLQVTGPDRVRFSVSIYVSTKTLDEDVRTFRDAATSDPKLALKDDQIQGVPVGGEQAQLLTGSYTQNGELIAVAVWFVDHGGKRFGLSADRIGTHRDEIDAIVASTSFVPAGAQVTATPASTRTAVAVPRAPSALPTTASIFGTATAARTPVATTLKVTLKDTSFTLSPTPIQAGSVPITIENTGTASYTVEFHGSGVNYVSPTIPPGQTLRVSLTFQAGTYTFVCNLPRPLTSTFSAQ